MQKSWRMYAINQKAQPSGQLLCPRNDLYLPTLLCPRNDLYLPTLSYRLQSDLICTSQHFHTAYKTI